MHDVLFKTHVLVVNQDYKTLNLESFMKQASWYESYQSIHITTSMYKNGTYILLVLGYVLGFG